MLATYDNQHQYTVFTNVTIRVSDYGLYWLSDYGTVTVSLILWPNSLIAL